MKQEKIVYAGNPQSKWKKGRRYVSRDSESAMIYKLSHNVSDTDECGGNMSMRHACIIVRERTR